MLSAIGAVSGKGSQARRAELVAELFSSATEVEQTFLRRLLTGELRQGALIGVMADAVAAAAQIPAAAVRRAAMLGGALPTVAAAALSGGTAALDAFTLQCRPARRPDAGPDRRGRRRSAAKSSAAQRCSRPN